MIDGLPQSRVIRYSNIVNLEAARHHLSEASSSSRLP